MVCMHGVPQVAVSRIHSAVAIMARADWNAVAGTPGQWQFRPRSCTTTLQPDSGAHMLVRQLAALCKPHRTNAPPVHDRGNRYVIRCSPTCEHMRQTFKQPQNCPQSRLHDAPCRVSTCSHHTPQEASRAARAGHQQRFNRRERHDMDLHSTHSWADAEPALARSVGLRLRKQVRQCWSCLGGPPSCALPCCFGTASAGFRRGLRPGGARLGSSRPRRSLLCGRRPPPLRTRWPGRRFLLLFLALICTQAKAGMHVTTQAVLADRSGQGGHV